MADLKDTVSVTFSITSTPFAKEPDHAREFYELVGRIVCLWGRFEYHLTTDLMFFLGNSACAGVNRPLPISWKKKVELWKDIFTKVLECAPHKERAVEFIIEADKLAKWRNVLQHSHWWGFTKDHPLTADFASAKEQNGKWMFLRQAINIDDLRQLATEIDGLNTRLLVVTGFMNSMNPPMPSPISDKS